VLGADSGSLGALGAGGALWYVAHARLRELAAGVGRRGGVGGAARDEGKKSRREGG
jgi:hypothetical protein